MSSQQVVSYLMDFEDHFKSDQYANLYWTSFEGFIEKEDPSPECHPQKIQATSNSMAEPETADEDPEDNDAEEPEPSADDRVEEDESNLNEMDDTITLEADLSGKFVPTANQVCDYQWRGEALQDVNVWDFAVACRHCGIPWRHPRAHPERLAHLVTRVGFDDTLRGPTSFLSARFFGDWSDLDSDEKTRKTMSVKNRAIGNTEDEFQAALATYTKAGNKTAAMRRLWNAAYEIGRLAAAATASAVLAGEEVRAKAVKGEKSRQIEEAKKVGFVEGRQAGFEEGRDLALTMDAFEVSFQSGKIAGRASGMEMGREAEEKRWTDAGHFANGTCRAFDNQIPSPIPSAPFLETKMDIPGTFNWADDAESLPIHTVLLTVREPRDLSGLRSGSTNPFDTLQRRHARSHGVRMRSRRSQPTPRYYSGSTNTQRRSLVPARSGDVGEGHLSVLGILAWVCMMFRAHLYGSGSQEPQATRTLPCGGGQMR
ncbi:hypothetical protein B0H11DRAFT_2182398 [Mycena galericulata]|nr:hypothetical protein B0H11DRAFT_2182398 [Mycena galericulata]